MKRKFTLLLLISAFAFNIGCSIDNTETYKEVVKKYNNLLSVAIKSSKAELLTSITSKKEKGRVEIFISQLDLKNQYMDSKLESIKFLESRLLSNKEAEEERKKNPNGQISGAKNKMATVRTDEKWQFTYIDKKTKKAVTIDKDIEYKVIYILEFRDKKWIVNDIYFN